MKKLIIAASVMMLGVVANASAINWDVTDIYTFDGASTTSTTLLPDGTSGYSAYFFVEDANVTRDSVLADLSNGETAFVQYGHVGESWGEGEFGGESGDVGTGTKSAFYVVFNNGDAANATYAFVGALQDDIEAPSSGMSGLFEDSAAATAAGSAWTAINAAPEPTSGLLLLLGVAGLALRRRRA